MPTIVATDAPVSTPVRRDTEVAELKQEVAMLREQLREERRSVSTREVASQPPVEKPMADPTKKTAARLRPRVPVQDRG